jgi:hypothetical protein
MQFAGGGSQEPNKPQEVASEAAQKWLYDQATPPRCQPVLAPGHGEEAGATTPRLALQNHAIQAWSCTRLCMRSTIREVLGCPPQTGVMPAQLLTRSSAFWLQGLASSLDNPMLLGETPLGGAEGHAPSWEAAAAPGLQRGGAGQRPRSAPATPAAKGAHAPEQPAERRAAARTDSRRLAEEAAALAASLAQLRLLLQGAGGTQAPAAAEGCPPQAQQLPAPDAAAFQDKGSAVHVLEQVNSCQPAAEEDTVACEMPAAAAPDLASIPARLQHLAARAAQQKQLARICEEEAPTPIEATAKAVLPEGEARQPERLVTQKALPIDGTADPRPAVGPQQQPQKRSHKRTRRILGWVTDSACYIKKSASACIDYAYLLVLTPRCMHGAGLCWRCRFWPGLCLRALTLASTQRLPWVGEQRSGCLGAAAGRRLVSAASPSWTYYRPHRQCASMDDAHDHLLHRIH